MKLHFSFWVLAFPLISATALTTGCSPRLTVQKYAYLIENDAHSNRDRQQIRQLKEVGIEQTGNLAVFSGPEPIQEQPKAVQVKTAETDLIIQTAKSYVGTPYSYGGMSRVGVDCSGLICLAYQSANKSLPRTSRALSEYGPEVRKNQLEPGHLVFFDAKNGQSINHVGMVVSLESGETHFIHATSSSGVRIDRLEDPYWQTRFRKGVAPRI